jgi:hypothetical protein
MTCDFVLLYVMPKLTLHVSEDLVTIAKSEAAARNVSVSKLVSDYFSSFAASPDQGEKNMSRLAPRTRRLAGSIPPCGDDTESYIDHLEAKHS